MPHVEILAHRGWWDRSEERNTLPALQRTFAAGMGVETDLRDCCGDIVISHDPPLPGALTFRAALQAYADAGKPGHLALNVKADGLQTQVKAALAAFAITSYFMFDMSIPDAMQWLKAGMQIFSRQSDVEPQPLLYQQAAGIWADGFTTDWITADFLETHFAAGKSIGVISPEIHGRDPQNIWNLLKQFHTTQSTAKTTPALMLCTDRITDARRFFYAQN